MTSLRFRDNNGGGNQSNMSNLQIKGNTDSVDSETLLRIMNNSARTFTCIKCNLVFPNGVRFSEHKRRVHPHFICGNCDFKCRRLSLFLTHIESRQTCKRFLDENPPEDTQNDVTPQNIAPIPIGGMTFILNYFRYFRRPKKLWYLSHEISF